LPHRKRLAELVPYAAAQGKIVMSSKNTPAAPRHDRRTGVDRRKVDQGPPKGTRDRRVHVEPRKPEVSEVEISPSDWASLTNLPPPPPKQPKVPK
jgi:hypothetical protein